MRRTSSVMLDALDVTSDEVAGDDDCATLAGDVIDNLAAGEAIDDLAVDDMASVPGDAIDNLAGDDMASAALRLLISSHQHTIHCHCH